ncbi:hypothetical protein BJ322DRAFT_265132 [Thelephora terrestris]|uniref:Uncharacterized protein n=1 Tax=Thelephora terrestris TaxID=56493 RepID=A0A9P6H7R0_9AGAM|nr:hypothetical protein BJ322DRAFT_265132 [Thelephora terrestris]
MLSVLCFSPVPILRCVAPGKIEFSTLLIPPGIELLFSIFLLSKQGEKGGRSYRLLCAEGISYFLLALMDFLSRAVTLLHQDLFVVKLVDIILGSLSVVPLLCFTLWFSCVAQEKLLHVIPARLRKLTRYFLISCIPLIAVFNATGAFIGMSYRTYDGVITIGFIDERAKVLWSIFNMLSLALLVVFEATACFLLFLRLVKVIRHKKQREFLNGATEIHHFRGIVFINLGMVLSLTETLLGFGPQTFSLAITRRGTKSAGRSLMVSGLLKGWDYLEDVRFVLQEPPKPKRISKLSFRQLIPTIRSPSRETQTSERDHGRVSVRHRRGRAPMLHLRLSGFDINPFMKAFRSPNRSSNSPQTHLIPRATQTGSPIEASERYLGVQDPHYINTPPDAPYSPLTPDSPRTVVGPTPRVSSSSNPVDLPQSLPVQDEHTHHQSHMRGETMSSTLSHLQVEVMTLSESPPDPGFVLPIPSRSRTRENFDLFLDEARSTRGSIYPTRAIVSSRACAESASSADSGWNLQEPRYTKDPSDDYGSSRPRREAPHRYILAVDEDLDLPPLDPPRPRRLSWVSESSDMSSAVISTATRLTRANTTVSVTSPATTRNRAAMSSDEGHPRRQITVASEHPLGNTLQAVHVEGAKGDTI